jgi:hypothetical protein
MVCEAMKRSYAHVIPSVSARCPRRLRFASQAAVHHHGSRHNEFRECSEALQMGENAPVFIPRRYGLALNATHFSPK